jgi:glycosyltransferase involved in cell wall biosynthesis
LIQDGVTGHLFRSGDWQDLVAKVRRLWDHPAEANQMGRQARAEYERKYTPERNYQILADIYSSVISEYQR